MQSVQSRLLLNEVKFKLNEIFKFRNKYAKQFYVALE